MSDYRDAYDRATFYYPDEIERAEQWQRYLELERKLVQLRIPTRTEYD